MRDPPRSRRHQQYQWSPLQVALVLVCMPVIEELVFREALQSLVALVLPAWAAIVTSAAARAMLADCVDDVRVFAAEGLVFGTAYALTGCVLVPIVMHAAWNAAAVYVLRPPYDAVL